MSADDDELLALAGDKLLALTHDVRRTTDLPQRTWRAHRVAPLHRFPHRSGRARSHPEFPH